LNAAIEHGADYIKAGPDGPDGSSSRHVRLDVQSLARDATTGALLRFIYRGKIATTGDAGRVLRGEEGAGTTAFGEACESALQLSPVFVTITPVQKDEQYVLIGYDV